MVCHVMLARGMHTNNTTKCSKALGLAVRILLGIFLYRINFKKHM